MGAWGIIGSFIYSYQEGDAEPQYIMAEQGTVDITLNGSEYTINAVVTAGGKEYKFRYTGAVTLKDVKDAGDPPAQDYPRSILVMNSHRATLSLTETSTKQAACPTTGSFVSLTAEWISQSRIWSARARY